MTELKLLDIPGLLPNKKVFGDTQYFGFLSEGANQVIDDLSTKNLLDYVEAVVCLMCDGTGSVIGTNDSVNVCLSCMGNGAVIRVKESK